MGTSRGNLAQPLRYRGYVAVAIVFAVMPSSAPDAASPVPGTNRSGAAPLDAQAKQTVTQAERKGSGEVYENASEEVSEEMRADSARGNPR